MMTHTVLRNFLKLNGWKITMDRKETVTSREMSITKSNFDVSPGMHGRAWQRKQNETLIKALGITWQDVNSVEWINETGEDADLTCIMYLYVGISG